MSERGDDVTEGATGRETAAAARARRRAIEGDAPMQAEEIGRAVAAALERNRDRKDEAAPLPEIVRASVRCGHETVRRENGDGSRALVTMPRKHTFKASETADGREVTVEHGRPVRLKREAFVRYLGEGIVVAG